MILRSEEWQVLALSLRVAFACVGAILLPAVALAWLLARRRFPGKALVDALVHAPLVLPPVVTGYLLLVLLGRNGWLGRWLAEHFGLAFTFSWTGAVLASAVVAFPLLVRPVRLAIELVSPRLEEAAGTLGASPLRAFLTVTLPLAAPGILTGAVLAFVRSLGEFGATIVFAGNIAGETRTLALAVFTALQIPGAEERVWRLALLSIVLSLAALGASELLARRLWLRLRGQKEERP